MIRLSNVCKKYPTRGGKVTVLDNVNLTVQKGERIGILGRNGAGKSTMIRLISGAEQPTSGLIERAMSVSWPLAFSGAFQAGLTGLDNLRFVCRIYGVDADDKVPFVQEFSGLGRYLWEPVRNYSAGMHARLAFAVSMVVEFDCFLIDEVVAVGDSRFHERCNVELFQKRADRAIILVSHDAGYIRAHCQHAAVLAQGRLHTFDVIDEAFEFYEQSSAAA